MASITGTWDGVGNWPIEWSFGIDGSFTKTDLISPCPPDVECIWSGIVTNQGIWQLEVDRVSLTYESPDTLEGTTIPQELLLSLVGGNVSALLEFDGDRLAVEYRRRA